MALRIELLDGNAGRDSFDCGVAVLNDFLSRQAGQQQRKGFGKTYVALNDGDDVVAGFVTVSVGQVVATELPPDLKLPRYPVPILRIERLAVDKRMQGQGVGHELLAFALHLALDFSERVGLYAVGVDTKDDRVAGFYRKLGFRPALDDALCLYLPLAVLRQTTASPDPWRFSSNPKCGQATSARPPENPKGNLSGRLFSASPTTGNSEAPEDLALNTL